MSVSKHTTSDTRVTEALPLFPPSLIGKKLLRDDSMAYRSDSVCLEHLEQYLETRNPDFLVKAIRRNTNLIQSKGRNLEVDEYLIEKGDKSIRPTTYIGGPTIVWETIRWWQNFHWMGTEDEYRTVKKLLLKILPPHQIFLREEHIIQRVGDGFVHVTEKIEGKHPYLIFESVIDYIQYYENIKEVFKTRRKRNYIIETKPQFLNKISDHNLRIRALAYGSNKGDDLVRANIRKIIQDKLGDKISENEVRSFEISDVNTITASYIAWKHEKICHACQKTIPIRKRKAKDENRQHRVSYKTFQRLYKKAKKELENN